MKPNSKRLTLNRDTLRQLGHRELLLAVGGVPTTREGTCPEPIGTGGGGSSTLLCTT